MTVSPCSPMLPMFPMPFTAYHGGLWNFYAPGGAVKTMGDMGDTGRFMTVIAS